MHLSVSCRFALIGLDKDDWEQLFGSVVIGRGASSKLKAVIVLPRQATMPGSCMRRRTGSGQDRARLRPSWRPPFLHLRSLSTGITIDLMEAWISRAWRHQRWLLDEKCPLKAILPSAIDCSGRDGYMNKLDYIKLGRVRNNFRTPQWLLDDQIIYQVTQQEPIYENNNLYFSSCSAAHLLCR